MILCKNCSHEVKLNYYGGWLHARQWTNYCAEPITTTKEMQWGKETKHESITKACGCTIPIG